MVDVNDPFKDVTLAVPEGQDAVDDDPYADVTLATDDEEKNQADIDAEIERLRERALDRLAKSAPFTGAENVTLGGYFDEASFSVDRIETPITDEEKENPIVISVVESEEYQNSPDSITRNLMIKNAIEAANLARFRDKGDAAFGGPGSLIGDLTGAEIRTQTFEVDGKPQTFLVPKPGVEADPGLFGGVQRTLGGGLLKAVKGFGESGEYVTDAIGLTDPETDYVSENFPTYATQSGTEETGSDIVSIVAGAATGAGAVAALEKSFKLSRPLAKMITSFWDNSKKANPANYKRGLETFIRGVLVERGANIGATAATPDTAEPLVGDSILEYFGKDPEANKNLSHYIDNEVFSFGINVLAQLAKGGKYLKKQFLPTGSGKEARRKREIGLVILHDIDPTLAPDTPLEEVSRRAYELGRVLAENKSFTSDLVTGGKEINLDSGSAIMLGAEQYYRRSLAWKLPIVGQEALEAEIKSSAADMANRIVAIKQARSASPIVNQADSLVNAQVQGVLREAGEEAVEGGRAGADAIADAEAEQIVSKISEARSAKEAAQTNVDIANSQLKATQEKDQIIRLLEDARETNTIGSTLPERNRYSALTGEKLYQAWKGSYDAYNSAFKNLPEGIEVDLAGFRDLVEELAKESNDFATLSLTTTRSDAFTNLLKDFRPQPKRGADGKPVLNAKGKVVKETPEEVIQRLQDMGKDLKFLYSTLRPEIGRRIGRLQQDKLPIEPGLLALKEFIDDAAQASGDESFVAAKNLYGEHESIFSATRGLSEWESTARQVGVREIDEAGNIVPIRTAEGEDILLASGRARGMPDTMMEGYRLLDDYIAEPTGIGMEQLLPLLKKVDPNAEPELANTYVSKVIKALLQVSDAGSPITSQQLRDAVRPQLQALENLPSGRRLAKLINDTTRNLEMAENGLTSTQKVLAEATAEYDEVIKQSQMEAASIFVYDITGNATVRANPKAAFDDLLKAKTAPDEIRKLLNNPDINPIIRDGIKSHFFDYVADQISTAKRLGADPTSGSTAVVNEASAAKLDKILGQRGGDNTLAVAKELFSDDPEQYRNFIDLLQIQNIALNNRAYRPGNFGSNTAFNIDNRKKVDRLIVLSLGVLNPAATKARNIGRVFTEMSDAQAQELYMRTFDMLMASPSLMKEAFDLVSKDFNAVDLVALGSKYAARGSMGGVKDRESDPTLEAIPFP